MVNRGGSMLSLGGLGYGKKVEEMVTMTLSETPTTIIFGLNSLVVASDTREVAITEERTARYEATVIAHQNPDGFATNFTQTANLAQKNQNESAAPTSLQVSPIPFARLVSPCGPIQCN